MKNNILTLLENASITGSSGLIKVAGSLFQVQASATTTAGTGSAIVVIEGSNLPNPTRNSDWNECGTITLVPTTSGVSDSFPVQTPWDKVRARVTTLSGTGVVLSVYLCEAR